MCVYMCVYIYICMGVCVCIYVYACACIFICVYLYVYMCTCLCVYVYVYVYMCMRIYLYVYVNMCLCACAYVCMCVCVRVYVYVWMCVSVYVYCSKIRIRLLLMITFVSLLWVTLPDSFGGSRSSRKGRNRYHQRFARSDSAEKIIQFSSLPLITFICFVLVYSCKCCFDLFCTSSCSSVVLCFPCWFVYDVCFSLVWNCPLSFTSFDGIPYGTNIS